MPDVTVPEDHRLHPFVQEGCQFPWFRSLWFDEGTAGFRQYAAAVLTLAKVAELSPELRASLYEKIATVPRAALLTSLIGSPVGQSALKLLAKSNGLEFEGNDWRALLRAAEDPSTRRALGHLDRVSAILARQIQSMPGALKLPAILKILNLIDVPPSRWERIGVALARAPRNVHAALLAKASRVRSVGMFWDFCFDCTDEMWRPFQLPDGFFGSTLLKPLNTPREMEEEGRKMRNCLAQRVRRVIDGREVYFRWSRSPSANVQMISSEGAWRLGRVLGRANSPMDPGSLAEISGCAAEIIARVPQIAGAAVNDATEEVVDHICARGRMPDFAIELQRVEQALRDIRGRTLEPAADCPAYAIFETDHGYVQFMSNVEGTEFLSEILSHKYEPAMEERLTGEVVDLIAGSGFQWPRGRRNFVRWFVLKEDSDMTTLAQFALGILHAVSGFRPGELLTVQTHIPTSSALDESATGLRPIAS